NEVTRIDHDGDPVQVSVSALPELDQPGIRVTVTVSAREVGEFERSFAMTGETLIKAMAAQLARRQSGSSASDGPVRRLWPEALTPELHQVLGIPNFRCSPIAAAFRNAGATIAPRAEAQQAFVLHWLVGLALQHGSMWRSVAADKIDELVRAVKGRAGR